MIDPVNSDFLATPGIKSISSRNEYQLENKYPWMKKQGKDGNGRQSG